MSVEIRIYSMSQRRNSVFIVIRIRGLEQGAFSISNEGLDVSSGVPRGL